MKTQTTNHSSDAHSARWTWVWGFRFAMLLAFAPGAFAVLGNAWHIPDNVEPGSVHMRNPEFEIGPTTVVTIYNGNQFQGIGNPGNQTGGTLFYRKVGAASYSSVALSFDSQNANNKYWKATIDMSQFSATDVIQYYLLVTYSDRDSTYLYGGDGASTAIGVQATAAASPFSFRNRPAWAFHANNRVVNPATNGDSVNYQDVQFWTKVGYITTGTNNVSTQWATNGIVYYTTDGSTPTGSLGVPSGTTQTGTCTYDHPESNNQSTPSIAGTAMWWAGTVKNMPTFTNIKYKIGFWNSATNEEKFADYNAGTPNTVFSFSIGTVGDPVLTIGSPTNGTLNGNYTTSHVFVDEVAGDSIPLTIIFKPGQAPITLSQGLPLVEVYTNLNRRDKATVVSNGQEEGIVPYDRNLLAAGDDTHYYKAYTMTPTGNIGEYSLTLPATNTGAYRLSARWKIDGDSNWRWYTNIPAGRRDHAVVVSPTIARNINLYEVNVFNLDASAASYTGRGTLEDLYDAPNAPHTGSNNHWNLNYLKNLGCNWMWFQPIHPITLEAQLGHDPGSPYSVRSFFDINPLMSVNYNASLANAITNQTNRDAARAAFTGLVSAANQAGVNVMLDAPFNHSAPDAELTPKGVQYLGSTGNPSTSWLPTDLIRSREVRFYSRTGNYAQRASYYNSSNDNNIAVAPDRGDFGKWSDVRDVFFGRYAALVGFNDADNGNYLNEQDWFDYSVGSESSYGTNNGHFDSITQGVWKYFADYTLYWLDQTGVPTNSSQATQTSTGLGGLRADFGQGLPPQLWEYIINKTRTRKWNFVFMAESLDGGAVTYRSNRHFDILNENIVFPLKSATTSSAFRAIFESRRSAYGQSLVLLNNMSHDEEAYADPWVALTKYAVCSTVDGVPLVFPGQELGISTTTGYSSYETNFGKNIANFKDYNSMVPIWNDTDYGNDQLYPVYSGIGLARLFSPALRSPNRYYLDQTGGGGTHQGIFAVAKYQAKNTSPNLTDVVFAFANVDRNNNQTGNFNVAQDTDSDGVNDYGIKPSRTYNVKNIAAYTAIDPNRRNYWQWRVDASNVNSAPQPRLGSDILNNGIFVGMNKVPTMVSGTNPSDPAWNQRPHEAQYLKIYDVTPPPNGGAPATPKAFSVLTSGTTGTQGQTTFSWSGASDPEGGISGYHVTITTGSNGTGTVLFDGTTSTTSQSVTGNYGQTVYASVKSVNNAGIESSSSTTSGGGTVLLNPNADSDGDGMTNAAEDTAGTNPLDGSSNLKITSVAHPAANSASITWSSVVGIKYVVESTTDLSVAFTPLSGTITATATTTSYTDTAASGAKKFYRVKVVP